ncbi:hypothetical protein INT47_003766 [Mucor saturninus]|uniref:Uncharacterized protein n=1 Tax=Mucor saturninus TaxID=64648 RepID=A0A8H7R823_9FUNG|nr:hypothetical protein INT47_003766 [Mucor saturninus]
MMVNRSKGRYNNLSPASFYRIICNLLKKRPSIHLSGIVNFIYSDMSKVILSSLPDHLKTKLDYILKISQLDPDTLGYIERILDFHSDVDGILEYIMVTKAALICGHKRNTQQYTSRPSLRPK